MVEAIRKLVAGKRNRYKDGEHSLDLSYIIPGRIIAMSYPANGIESYGRNYIVDVARFLEEKHGSKYYLFNTSERATYDGE